MKQTQAIKHISRFFVLIFLFSTAVFLHGENAKAEEGGEKISARVNGTDISESLLMQGVNAHRNKFKKSGMTAKTPEYSDSTTKIVLDKMINQLLLAQASQAETISDIDERIDAALASKKAEAGLEERFANYLTTKQMSVQSYRHYLKNKIHMDEYLKRKGISTPEISDQEIREFYNKGDGMQQEETVKIRHILLTVAKEAKKNEKEKIRLKSHEILNQINEGMDFAELARFSSQCKKSNTQGGDLGYIKRGFMPEPFEKVAFSLPVGTTSGVIETEYGFHILQVMDRREAGRIPYEKTRDFLKKYLQERRMPLLLDKHIAELRQKADIQIF